MVCRFNPVAFSAAGKNGKTSWVRPELVPKISFCLGKKSVLFLEKTKHSGNFGEKTKMKIWPKIFPVKTQGK